ncbi:MAG: hypothetical protein HYZ00_10030 [Candidatus Hydrogenedentes bacterium]|nr:hypothetical protein [Candidatus Hydrogenedentota bacterium]
MDRQRAISVSAKTGPILENNILLARGAGGMCIDAYDINAIDISDYNDLVVEDGAKLGEIYQFSASTLREWRSGAAWDLHSISTAPLFADEANGDYHLISTAGRWDPAGNGGAGGFVVDAVTSPCIDGGDPAADVGAESTPNGGIVNMGAYGGTAEASKSPASGKWLVLDHVGRGTYLHAYEPIRWLARGPNWGVGETVHLEYWDPAGAAWNSITGAEALPFDAEQFWWDSRTVPDGAGYEFRVVANGAPAEVAASDRSYTVQNLQVPWNPTPADGAVNVPVNTNLEWHSAAGASSYDLYLWLSSQAKPATPTVSGITGLFYDPPLSLRFNSAYRWQVVARNAGTQVPSPTWTFTTAQASGDVYVDLIGGSDANGDGSPATPFLNVNFALSILTGSSVAPFNVRVSEGTVRETVTMHAYEHLYGGYHAGDWIRDSVLYPTIADGENSRTCVTASTAVLDGFEIRNGQASGGAGLNSYSVSPVIRNCIFDACTASNGGGVYVRYGSAVFENCLFTNCSVTGWGGAIYTYSTSAQIRNCRFEGCSAASGGGVLSYVSPDTIANCVFTNCSASSGGGGINTYASPPQIRNCLFTACQSPNGGAVWTYSSSPQIVNCTMFGNVNGVGTASVGSAVLKNCIVWNNGDDLQNFTAAATQYCDIEDGDFAGTNGNISADPLFYDASTGNLHLLEGSPCIDAGTSTGAPADDLDGLPRPLGLGVDMGCYEWNPDLPERPALPDPPDGATDLPLNTALDWADCARASSYAVYLWPASQSKPLAPTATGLSASDFDPPANLLDSTPYLWQVLAMNATGDTPGPVWEFTTYYVGALKVTLLPTAARTAGAMWKLDDGEYHPSHYTLAGILAGPHTIHFKPIAGWITPADQPVEILPAQLTNATAQYQLETGALKVRLLPAEARAAGAMWRVDGGTWLPSHYTQQNLTPGTHLVTFKALPCWVTPLPMEVTVLTNQTLDRVATYARQTTGAVKVRLVPAAARDAGAMWWVDDRPLRPSHYTETGLEAGPHTLHFLAPPGWCAPEDTTIDVAACQTLDLLAEYKRLGALKIQLLPAAARDAGARWRLDGGAWWPSHKTLSGLCAGLHWLEFLEVAGWQAPPAQAVEVFPLQTALMTYTYAPAVLAGPSAPSAGEGEGEGDAASPIKDLAEEVLAVFVSADADQDGALTLAEAQSSLETLTADQFAALDFDHDGALGEDELRAAASPGGCSVNNSLLRFDISGVLVDLLLGTALLTASLRLHPKS